jgi:UDP-GlcNAc3NAcA epimerase
MVTNSNGGDLKIVSVVGARPQFIKAAIVSRILRSTPEVEEILVHTGQHYDNSMSERFFEELDIPRPDHCLGVGSGTHGAQTGQMLQALDQALSHGVPDVVSVYGDTNSTLAGALAAAKLHIPVAHVEAGLRSYNRDMPEEINRVLTDHASTLLFAPTEIAVNNLKREGIAPNTIFLVGDVMYDAALHYASKAESESHVLQALSLTPKKYILATIHRAENTDNYDRLRTIFAGLSVIARQTSVVIPLHPRTRSALKRYELLDKVSDNLHVTEPIGYLDMVMLEKHSLLIATDSGGVQKEAFFYGVPCVTLRGETEWIELVEMGWNRVVPPFSTSAIVEGLSVMLDRRGVSAFPYGNGNAAQEIVNTLLLSHHCCSSASPV